MKRLTIVYFSLIMLTLLSAYVADVHTENTWVPILIVMGLVCIKFIMVVLEFMEMRKSNPIWKFSVILPAVLTAIIVGIFAVV